MKKLILVTLLAVAASWVLHEAAQSDREKAAIVNLERQVLEGREVQVRESRPPSKRRPRPERHGLVTVVQEPAAPMPPVPPAPPESIRAVPWRPVEAARPGRAQAPKTAASQAKEVPSWFPKSEDEEEAGVDAFGSKVVVGRVSASEDRARQDLRRAVELAVSDWLAADVPTSWHVPPGVIDAMGRGSYVQEVVRTFRTAGPEAADALWDAELARKIARSSRPADADAKEPEGTYTLYRAGQKLDFSPSVRAQVVGLYRRDLAADRLKRLGGGLALALVGLAVLSGYIRADEATKGYYTKRLRVAALVGLGAAGAAAYRFLV